MANKQQKSSKEKRKPKKDKSKEVSTGTTYAQSKKGK